MYPFFSFPYTRSIKRRLSNIQIAVADQLLHVAEEKGKQKSANVRAVNIGIGHQDNAVITEPGGVKVFVVRLGFLIAVPAY